MKEDAIKSSVREDNGGERTNILLTRSISGNGLVIKTNGKYVLTVSIEAVKKLINGTWSDIHFTKFPAPDSCIVLEP